MANLNNRAPEIVGAETDYSGYVETGTKAVSALSNLVSSIWGGGGKSPASAPATTTVVVQSAPMPAWVMPVGIGAVALAGIAFFANTRKKRRR